MLLIGILPWPIPGNRQTSKKPRGGETPFPSLPLETLKNGVSVMYPYLYATTLKKIENYPPRTPDKARGWPPNVWSWPPLVAPLGPPLPHWFYLIPALSGLKYRLASL